MTAQQNNNIHVRNQEYNIKMMNKYQSHIRNDKLVIGDSKNVDSDLTTLQFIETLNVKKLKLYYNNTMSLKLRSNIIIKLTVDITELTDNQLQSQIINFNVDDLDLENLETLKFNEMQLGNDQLFYLSKFKKLQTLAISKNNADLTHIHSIISLTSLYMSYCGLHQIDQIGSLINLEILDLSMNQLKSINSIQQLSKLKDLNISQNKRIDVTPLIYLTNLVKLDLNHCELNSLSAIKLLSNLLDLDISWNLINDITDLQYLLKLTKLSMQYCGLVSICVLRPLQNLIELDISHNNIVYIHNYIMMKLKQLQLNQNLISDFTKLEQHPYFSDFDISNQEKPSIFELNFANQIRKIERQNISLKQIQNICQIFKPKMNQFKDEINVTTDRAKVDHILFMKYIVHLFQQLSENPIFE
ncbi:leucine-rich_repeat domain-containing protein [Hexamita inflata]|uniref:Leucine-rich repeat domain-containing protein n=1 Tax=Hexamita inflata TaxID=28002 RepID=A0AA86QJ75_9EUKA|nr:leucine-rich repeat domain-containing protein [Hexamita inflata]